MLVYFDSGFGGGGFGGGNDGYNVHERCNDYYEYKSTTDSGGSGGSGGNNKGGSGGGFSISKWFLLLCLIGLIELLFRCCS